MAVPLAQLQLVTGSRIVLQVLYGLLVLVCDGVHERRVAVLVLHVRVAVPVPHQLSHHVVFVDVRACVHERGSPEHVLDVGVDFQIQQEPDDVAAEGFGGARHGVDEKGPLQSVSDVDVVEVLQTSVHLVNLSKRNGVEQLVPGV